MVLTLTDHGDLLVAEGDRWRHATFDEADRMAEALTLLASPVASREEETADVPVEVGA